MSECLPWDALELESLNFSKSLWWSSGQMIAAKLWWFWPLNRHPTPAPKSTKTVLNHVQGDLSVDFFGNIMKYPSYSLACLFCFVWPVTRKTLAISHPELHWFGSTGSPRAASTRSGLAHGGCHPWRRLGSCLVQTMLPFEWRCPSGKCQCRGELS